MEEIHVVVGLPMNGSHLEEIRAVDPRVEVAYVAEELRAELDIAHSAVLPALEPIEQPALTQREATEVFDQLLPDTEIYFGWRFPLNFLARAANLKWVQWIGAGIDILYRVGLMQSDVSLTHAHGVTTGAVAEYGFCLMNMLSRGVLRVMACQREHHWQPFVCPGLEGKTLGLVGLGNIGKRLAGLARPFGMNILGVEKLVRERAKDEFGVDEVFPPEELIEMIPRCDFLVLSAPLTPETRGMIGESELTAMKPSAYLINIARGPLVQEKALIRVLRERRIAGAGLDVFETEPLPPESELWDMPNVILSSHTAPYVEGHIGLLTALFCDNLGRYLRGERLRNLIDKEAVRK